MREILRHPRLNFDRSFSERGTRQLVWLACAIVIVFTILFLLSYLFAFDETDVGGNQQMGRLMRLITLFIDPGAIESMLPSTRTFAIIVSVTGLVMMTGMFISVLTNMLDVHIDKVKNGETHYTLKGHVVVIGMDDLVPSLINQICNEAQFKGSYILVQSTEEAENVRSRIRNVIDKGKETRIIIYRGKRNSLEDLQALCIPDAKAVFLIGEPHETDKDSMNIESLRMISELCGKWASKRKTCAEAIPVAVQFEHQATFAAFQVTDLSTEWRKHIDFQPFNFHESWGQEGLRDRRLYEKPCGRDLSASRQGTHNIRQPEDRAPDYRRYGTNGSGHGHICRPSAPLPQFLPGPQTQKPDHIHRRECGQGDECFQKPISGIV